MAKTFGDVAKALVDGKRIGHLKQVGLTADWINPTWDLGDGEYLVNDIEDLEPLNSWLIIHREYDDEGEPVDEEGETLSLGEVIERVAELVGAKAV